LTQVSWYSATWLITHLPSAVCSMTWHNERTVQRAASPSMIGGPVT
jgi:hypothetical protein